MPLQKVTFDEKDLHKLFRVQTPIGRFWKISKSALKGLLTFSILFAIFFFAINYSAFFNRASYLSRGEVATPNISQPTVVAGPKKPDYRPEIRIAKINILAPVIYNVSYDSIIESLRSGVVHYQGSALPGQIGNTVLLGHSSDFPWSSGQYKTVFSLLDQLVIGDVIEVPYGQHIYSYKISEIKRVKPSDLSVLERTADSRVTLITCYPVGTAISRLIVIGQLSGKPLNGTQTTQPFLGEEIVNAR